VTFQVRCALLALPACSGHPGFYVGNEGLPVGCPLDGPTKCFWVLGHYKLETFLRSACLGWLCETPCSNARYLGVSTLHTFKINSFLALSSIDLRHHNFSYDIVDDFFMRCTFHDLAFILGYWISSDVANMASYAISSSLILVIHDNMIIGTNHIVLACHCRHF
jgi:hypothetical protein